MLGKRSSAFSKAAADSQPICGPGSARAARAAFAALFLKAPKDADAVADLLDGVPPLADAAAMHRRCVAIARSQSGTFVTANQSLGGRRRALCPKVALSSPVIKIFRRNSGAP